MDAERVGTLTGRELGGLIDALLDAYVRRDEFEMLLMLRLDKPPGTLSDDGGLKACVFKLVITAKSQGWLTDLIDAAIAERPGNPKLKTWVMSVSQNPAVLQAPPRAPSAVIQQPNDAASRSQPLRADPSVIENIPNPSSAAVAEMNRAAYQLTLEESALVDTIAEEHTEPDYLLEDQSWYAPLPPEFREIDHEKAQALRARIDAVLITATQVELLAVLRPMRPVPGRRKVLLLHWDNETYYLGRFGEYLVAVTKCSMGSMGNGSAILATIQAQHSWFPRAVIMIGIAFGKDRTKQRIADVIVASQVISYEPQRVGSEHVPRGPIPPTNDLLLNRFENAADWWFERPDKSRCRLIVGPVLSGEKLVDDPKFKKDLFTKYPQAVGGEMEGPGWARPRFVPARRGSW